MARKIMKLKKKQKTFFALPKMFSLKMMVDKICSTLSVKNAFSSRYHLKILFCKKFLFCCNSLIGTEKIPLPFVKLRLVLLLKVL